MYQVKEIFYSLQGEGAQAGRASVFCRFTGCNLWSGRERDRATAICDFCDTDFVGTDGQNGGKFASADALAQHLMTFWPCGNTPPYLVFTGGEPLLQLDTALVQACKRLGMLIAVETNGTLEPPAGIDWLCVSPKGSAQPVILQCDELKLVFPQAKAMPDSFAAIQATFRFLSPKNDPKSSQLIGSSLPDHWQQAIQYCLAHPQWRLTMQGHKLWQID